MAKTKTETMKLYASDPIFRRKCKQVKDCRAAYDEANEEIRKLKERAERLSSQRTQARYAYTKALSIRNSHEKGDGMVRVKLGKSKVTEFCAQVAKGLIDAVSKW